MTSPTRDEARERLAAAVKARMAVAKADARHRRCDPEREFAGATVSGLRLNDLRALLSDQPRPSVSEDQGASRDLALTDGVALDGWQPIETAPRDGTEILIAIGSDYIGSAFYAVVAIGSDYIGSAFYADDDSDPYPWKFFDRNGIKPLANGIRDDRMGPTHWMPLPAPPSSAKPAPDAVPGTNPKTTDKGGE